MDCKSDAKYGQIYLDPNLDLLTPKLQISSDVTYTYFHRDQSIALLVYYTVRQYCFERKKKNLRL